MEILQTLAADFFYLKSKKLEMEQFKQLQSIPMHHILQLFILWQWIKDIGRHIITGWLLYVDKKP